MNLPSPKEMDAYIAALFSTEYGEKLKRIAKPVNPLAECSPTPWAKSPEGVEL